MQLSGATGMNAHRINGYYEPIDEIVGNATVYKKMGGADIWIEYYAGTGRWYVRLTPDRGTNSGWALATISPARPLEDCPSSCWHIGDGIRSRVNQPSFSVSISSRALFEASKVIKSLYFSVVSLRLHMQYLYMQ